MKIALVGCGKLGKAFVRAFLNTKLSSESELLLIDREEWQVEEFRLKQKLHCLTRISDEIKKYEAIVLAVKPQDFEQMASELAPHISSNQLVLSVMTGITIERMSSSFANHTQIVRSMPNLPAQIGKSITAFTCHKQLSTEKRAKALAILSAVGSMVELEDESLMNAVTALSATGPGYVYEIISHMIQAAKEMGFSHGQACSLIADTFTGSIELWMQSGLPVEELRDTVKSKGGTTEAALKRFAEGDLGRTLQEGILAAYSRAVELGKGK